MTYHALARLGATVRPIEHWPGPTTPPHLRERSRFTSPVSATVGLLAAELAHLDAANIVIGLAIAPNRIRLDGLPYADARTDHPGVLLAFDSAAGPLRFACDRYIAGGYRAGGADWTHNLRAIALTLHALRAVERYGATSDQQQYRGYAALPAGTPMPPTHLTTDEAIRLIARHAGTEPDLVETAVFADGDLPSVVRAAMAATHPDRGGDPDEFVRVQAARDLLTRARQETT